MLCTVCRETGSFNAIWKLFIDWSPQENRQLITREILHFRLICYLMTLKNWTYGVSFLPSSLPPWLFSKQYPPLHVARILSFLCTSRFLNRTMVSLPVHLGQYNPCLLLLQFCLISHCFSHSLLATPTFFLLWEHSQLFPTSGPLHMLVYLLSFSSSLAMWFADLATY